MDKKKFNRLKRFRIIRILFWIIVILWIPYSTFSYEIIGKLINIPYIKVIVNIPYFGLLLFCFIYIKTFACPRCDNLWGNQKKCRNCELLINYDKTI